MNPNSLLFSQRERERDRQTDREGERETDREGVRESPMSSCEGVVGWCDGAG